MLCRIIRLLLWKEITSGLNNNETWVALVRMHCNALTAKTWKAYNPSGESS